MDKQVTKFKESDINKLTNVFDNKYGYVNNYELTPYFGENIENIDLKKLLEENEIDISEQLSKDTILYEE